MAAALSAAHTCCMEIARARWLVSSGGREALRSLEPGIEDLGPTALSTHLRRRFPPAEAAALGEQVTLRAKARARFGSDPGMLFSAGALEMMTHPAVSSRRARRLAALQRPVVDLTCGIGGDLRAVSEAGAATAGLERDRATAVLAAANVPGAAVVQGDARTPPFDLAGCAVVVDPARRSGVTRTFDPGAFSPPWDVCLGLLDKAAAGVLKAPPGIDHRHLPPAAEVEFVQVGRSLREAAVWAGEGIREGLRRAVLLPGGHSISSDQTEASATTIPPSRYVYDPESCVTRAGLVLHLAARLGARLMDPQLAYLTSDAPAFDPLAATFEVVDVLPFSLARLRDYLRASHLRPDEIRRRAFPIEPDELRKLLGKLEGDPITLLMTTVALKRTIILARRVRPNG